MATKSSGLIKDAISDEIVNITEKFVTESGTKDISVRKILVAMNVTNRVFYNRFHNIEEVFEIIYSRTVLKMRDSFHSAIDPYKDFFGYVTDVAVKVLIQTYDVKNQFSQYMFDFDSSSVSNHNWWNERIKKIIEIGKEKKQLKDIDPEMLSYSVWCFFRGFNADAVKRKLSREEAVEKFRFGLSCLFEGVKNN